MGLLATAVWLTGELISDKNNKKKAGEYRIQHAKDKEEWAKAIEKRNKEMYN